jgi:2-keto-4-pentenoate hydratase
LALDGRSAGSARVGLTLADLLAPVVWLANHAMTRSNGLRCGDIVITGARIGPVPLLNATRVEARGSPFPPVMFFRAA